MFASAFRRRLNLVVRCTLFSAMVLVGFALATTSKAQAATSETLVVPFVNGPTGATTANSYSGTVTISVSGSGQAAGTQYSDAFYIFTDSAGNPITPQPANEFGLYINNQPATQWIGSRPAYSSNHTYQFTITADGTPLKFTFGVGDTGTYDNTGSFTITVTGEATPPAAAADLSVASVPSKTSIPPGRQLLAYNITVTNNGPDTATGVKLTDTFSPSVEIQPGTLATSQGTCVVALPVKCDLGTLGSGVSAKVAFAIATSPTNSSSITNTATVTANEPDPNQANINHGTRGVATTQPCSQTEAEPSRFRTLCLYATVTR